MEHEKLKETIISLASKNMFNGVGRVLKDELRELGYSEEQIIRAIEELANEVKINVVGDIIKIRFY